MAIIKTGDNKPIENFYNSDGEKEKCSVCGNELVVIAINDQENELVCTNCESQDDQ